MYPLVYKLSGKGEQEEIMVITKNQQKNND